MRVLVTGAAGRIGSQLVPRLTHELRLLDLVPLPGGVVADFTDPAAIRAACDGVDAVVHLAAIPSEAPWEELQRINVDGTRTVLEAAREAGVSRVLLPSSIQAAGFYRRPDSDLPATVHPRPSTYYGVSKAAIEALGALYADRFGMTVFVPRIGACFPVPPDHSALASWLSPDDCARLVDACLTASSSGFHLIWGISRNTRRWLSLAEGEAIGYSPRDDAEAYAARLPDGGDRDCLGGNFCALPLGEWGPYLRDS